MDTIELKHYGSVSWRLWHYHAIYTIVMIVVQLLQCASFIVHQCKSTGSIAFMCVYVCVYVFLCRHYAGYLNVIRLIFAFTIPFHDS